MALSFERRYMCTGLLVFIDLTKIILERIVPYVIILRPLFCVAFIFFIHISICGAAYCAEQNALDASLERLAEQTGQVELVTSDFKQTKYISFMDEKLVSEGTLVFRAPAELEWEYTRPVASGLIYKNGKARMWAASSGVSAEQARKAASSGGGGAEEAIGKIVAEQIITWTSLDIPALKRAYNISLLEETPLTIRLTPKELSPNNPIRDFKLVFAPGGLDLRQITLYEAEDDYTQVDFINFKRK